MPDIVSNIRFLSVYIISDEYWIHKNKELRTQWRVHTSLKECEIGTNWTEIVGLKQKLPNTFNAIYIAFLVDRANSMFSHEAKFHKTTKDEQQKAHTNTSIAHNKIEIQHKTQHI